MLDSNLFYNQFFFSVFLKNFAPVFADAVKLYNNPFYTPGIDKEYDNSIQNYFVTKNGVPIDNFVQLSQYDPVGSNKPTFFKPKLTDNTDYKLFVDNLFTPTDPNFTSILSYTGPQPSELGSQSIVLREQAILFLQRLLYPYKTDAGRVPKHNYFVSDLEKSTTVGIISNYNYTPSTDSQNVSLEWQLPNIYAYHSFLTEKEGSSISNYYKDIVSLDHQSNLKLEEFSINKYYDISNNSQDYLSLANSTDPEEYSKFYKL